MDTELTRVQKLIASSFDEESQYFFIIDVGNKRLGEQVSLAGIVDEKYLNRGKGTACIFLRDITGRIKVIMSEDLFNLHREAFHKGNRISLVGIVGSELDRENRSLNIIKDISQIQTLGLVAMLQVGSEIDDRIKEKEALLLLSKIIEVCSKKLQSHNFVRFESKLLSTHSDQEGLESLQVIYPGFGAPAALITSPAPQVIEFMLVSFLDRAFTVATSFASSYRFPNSGAEMEVVVAKATNLYFEAYKALIFDIAKCILAEFSVSKTPIEIQEYDGGKWENIDSLDFSFSKRLNYIEFEANIPVHQKNWHAKIESIHQIVDDENNLLLEGARENLGRTTISTITVYPTQFLATLKKNPMRTIRNLWRIGYEK